jgi:hypothetical protein
MNSYFGRRVSAWTTIRSGQQLSAQQLDQVSGGYTTMQWEYTKQDDTGAAKATVAPKALEDGLRVNWRACLPPVFWTSIGALQLQLVTTREAIRVPFMIL